LRREASMTPADAAPAVGPSLFDFCATVASSRAKPITSL
jgi:hypothetical protein